MLRHDDHRGPLRRKWQSDLLDQFDEHASGYKKTIMNWADGTQYVIDETPEGVRNGAFTLPDGRHGVLPPDSPLLVQTVPDRIGDVLTGLGNAHRSRRQDPDAFDGCRGEGRGRRQVRRSRIGCHVSDVRLSRRADTRRQVRLGVRRYFRARRERGRWGGRCIGGRGLVPVIGPSAARWCRHSFDRSPASG